MPYNPELDELVEVLLDGGETGVHVSVMCYDDGDYKIQISRKIKGNPVRLGRLSLAEAKRVAEAILKYTG